MTRIRNLSGGLLCGLLICCLCSAMAQNSAMGGSTPAGSGGSGSSPEEVNASVSNAVGASADALVSASSESNANAVATQPGGGGFRSPSVKSNVQHGSTTTKDELRHLQLTGRVRYRTISTVGNLARGRGATGSTKASASPGGIRTRAGTGFQEQAAYTDDFPDSTKGKAMLSPPDPGTQSPLEWSPHLDFSFGNMAEVQFLNPSLHVGGRLRKQTRRTGNIQRGERKAIPTLLPSSALSNVLEPGVLGETAAPSSIDQTLTGLQ